MEKKIKFQVPDQKKRDYVLGKFETHEVNLQNYLNILKQNCQVIKKPKQGEWLYENPHEGQTFNLYKQRVLKMGEGNIATPKKNKIYFQVLDKDIETQTLENLKNYIQAFFQLPVIILQNKVTIKKMKDIQKREETNQFCALDIFNQIDKLLPQDGICIIGITLQDLFIDEENNFVFGLADPRARKGIFSFCRYFPQFYENFNINNIQQQQDYNFTGDILRSGCKVLCHEISHLFGLRHCAYYQCIMQGSNSLQENQDKPLHMCPVCLRKLTIGNQNLNILQRYQDLLKICQDLGEHFIQEQQFYTKLINQLNNKSNQQQQQQKLL